MIGVRSVFYKRTTNQEELTIACENEQLDRPASGLVFGKRRGPLSVAYLEGPTATRAPTFGKRNGTMSAMANSVVGTTPSGVACAASARLSALCSDLSALYADNATPNETPLFRVTAPPGPRLLVGECGSVALDPACGVYVFTVDGSHQSRMSIETSSEACLLDHVVYHLALNGRGGMSVTPHGLIASLVGRSVADVERSLVFSTLRHYQFNRTHAAAALGISIRTIRNKLKAYRREAKGGVHPRLDNEILQFRSPSTGAIG